jgi:hypothetical protein
MVIGMSVKPELPSAEYKKWNPYKRNNAGIAHLLSIVYDKEPITTSELLKELGSVEYGQRLIRRAKHEGLITRKEGKQLRPGQFRPVYNTLTEKGRSLLLQELKGLR